MKIKALLLIGLLVTSSLSYAQEVKKMHGKATYIVTLDDNVTMKEAKERSITNARAQAIKDVFGEIVTSDIVTSDVQTDDKLHSQFWENTMLQAKGDWLGDTKQPVVDVSFQDGMLSFTAEVWGEAREILQSKIAVDWDILVGGTDDKNSGTLFNNAQRLYVKFKAPVKGYAAVWLLDTNEASCLLPYREDKDGKFDVQANRKYVFFDKESDSRNLYPYKLTTKLDTETFQIVLIFSPNPFTKPTLTLGDHKVVDHVTTMDFQRWLLGCQRTDTDMVVMKQWVKVRKN